MAGIETVHATPIATEIDAPHDLPQPNRHNSVKEAVSDWIGTKSDLGYWDNASATLGVHLGLPASEFAPNSGFNFGGGIGIDAGLQFPYGLGIETKLGWYGQPRYASKSETNTAENKILQEHPEWTLSLTESHADYFFPTVLQFRTPPFFQNIAPTDLRVGAGLTLQSAWTGERLIESHSTSTTRTTKPQNDIFCDEDDTNYNDITKECTYTETETDTNVLRDSLHHEGVALKPVLSASVRVNPGIEWPWWLGYDGNFGITLGYMHFFDAERPELSEDFFTLGLSTNIGLKQ